MFGLYDIDYALPKEYNAFVIICALRTLSMGMGQNGQKAPPVSHYRGKMA